MKKKSLARNITLVLTGLISLAVCIAALMTYGVYRHMEEKMIKELIQTESNRLISRVSRFGDVWKQPFERDMAPTMFAWGESDEVRAASLPPELRELPLGMHALDRGDSTWHVVVADTMDGRLYVLYDSVMLEQQLGYFSRALAGIVLGCSLLAMLISSAVARRLIVPLNLLTERLARWVPDSAGADPPHANEADRLMAVFNRVQAQVDASIADQREFSANLHHEIRTPLTVIRSDAELMLRIAAPEAAPLRPRLERIVRSVQEIDQSLQSTYSLAHARFQEETLVDLCAAVEDLFETLHLEADKAGLALMNQVSAAHREMLSRHALMTVMRNIVRNAVLHASPARLVVASLPRGLSFTDTGPGIEPSELDHVFERYFSNRRVDRRQHEQGEAGAVGDMNQTGLGLAIAKRVCVMQGWTLEAESPVGDGKGTRFTLAFAQEA